jgi:hypothetical protein
MVSIITLWLTLGLLKTLALIAKIKTEKANESK